MRPGEAWGWYPCSDRPQVGQPDKSPSLGDSAATVVSTIVNTEQR